MVCGDHGACGRMFAWTQIVMYGIHYVITMIIYYINLWTMRRQTPVTLGLLQKQSQRDRLISLVKGKLCVHLKWGLNFWKKKPAAMKRHIHFGGSFIPTLFISFWPCPTSVNFVYPPPSSRNFFGHLSLLLQFFVCPSIPYSSTIPSLIPQFLAHISLRGRP